MKICITCIYWTLLFISVASSALLFIIVACENAQTNYYLPLKKNETKEIYDNDTLDHIEDNSIETSNIALARLKNSKKLDIPYEDHYYEVRIEEDKEKFVKNAIDFENVITSKTRRKENPYNNPDIVAESLTQQPNLSQGISESEQATVLPLVDTTVAELQSLAEPKLNAEFSRTRAFGKNSSLLTKSANLGQTTKKEQQEISPSTQTPSPPSIDKIKEATNGTDILQDESLLLPDSVTEEIPEVVVVVRAEQGPITTDELEFKQEDDVKALPDEVPKVDGTFATTPELSDAEAKARLVGDNRDEAATVVLGESIVPVGSTNPHEDIPSFSEWTQKRLEEAEKKKTHPNASVQNAGTPTRGVGGMKVRSKNYASPDCGAKIVAANPEARSARSVLVSTRDEYMLNTCTSRIWFVVELCEAIQAKKIELANFELFSSSPKDFSVYISDRFPTRDWSLVGQFTAKDTKDIQSFPLQPHLFGKFIKIELHTYYGSEHFCPISLFRAYGTSEFEVLETETENQISRETSTDVDDEEDSDEEEVLDAETGEPPRNLFGSARDAVLSIMKKAAEVLVKSSELTGNNITKIQQSMDSGNILENSFLSCTTPRYTILCDKCSDQKFAKIFQLVSCREKQLNQLLKIDLVNRTLRQSGLCKAHGVGVETFEKKEMKEFVENVKDVEYKDSTKNFQLTFITSIFKSEYIAALCNVLAIKERKMVMNTSHEIPFNNFKDAVKEDVPDKHKEDYSEDGIKAFQHASTTCSPSSNTDSSKLESSKVFQKNTQEPLNKEVKFTGAPIEIFLNTENINPEINPTKTFEKEEIKNDSSVPILESIKGSIEETVQADVLTTDSIPLKDGQHSTLKVEKPLTTSGISIDNSPPITVSVPTTTIESTELPNDEIGSEVEPLEFAGMQNKMEPFDQEGKQGQGESNVEQDVKLPPQDPLIDTLLSDLKDLEGEAPHVQNEPVIQLATNTMPQKESVFLRLSNRIKALERNMSLSGQYLEELSRRYKKQVEEMQRSLERTVSAMNEETRKREERESKRAEEIAILREELADLSNSMKNLLYDRDSWRGKLLMISQHILLMCSEVFVIYLFVLYCRKSNKRSQMKENQLAQKDPVRRKSAENFSSHTRKTKKRRPSEIASHISGTYRELMINDKSQETKKEKKKKRKKGTVISNRQTNTEAERSMTTRRKTSLTDNVEIPLKTVSSYETLQTDDSQKQICRRLKSAPENTDWFSNTVCQTQLITPCTKSLETESVRSSELSNSCIDNLDESNSLLTNMIPKTIPLSEHTVNESSTDVLNSKNSSVILKDIKLSATSSFMRSAWSSRKKRKANLNDMNGEWSRNLEDSEGKSVEASSAVSKIHPHGDLTPTNGLLLDQSDESTSSSITSVSKKRDKKGSSFRKMVRKFF
ncbi:SUN domain-containing ossification factor isoform X1 [Osmia bicornis bicornis]|uniref:SUN domain-containing ossification factor isoform X1 n=1 Tax=Osmia bicornis bicornis TaxID=1437191 RepID=UPI001EAF841C|nr:SUN domain-containing ossification factor isoform X1 [Osmia bicornis bicornis]